MIKEKLALLSAREKLLTLIAGMAALLYLINSGVIAPVYKSYYAKREYLASLHQKKARFITLKQAKQGNRPRIEALLKKRDLLEERLAIAKNNIVDSSRLNDLLRLLGDPATDPDITLIGLSVESSQIVIDLDNRDKPFAIKNTSFKKENNHDGTLPPRLLKYDRNNITLSVKAGFGSLAHLFPQIFNGSLPLSISRFTITRDNSSPGTPGLIANIDFLLYTLPK